MTLQVKEAYKNLAMKAGQNPTFFFQALNGVATRLKIPLDWLCDIIYIESKFNPQAKNPNSTATGLIQFMASTALSLGTTTSDLKGMNGVQQLPYVEKYFKAQIAQRGQPKTFFDCYCLVFYPIWVNAPDSSRLAQSAYTANKGLDLDKNGSITKSEFRNWALKQVSRSPFIDLKVGSFFLVLLGSLFAAYKLGALKLPIH